MGISIKGILSGLNTGLKKNWEEAEQRKQNTLQRQLAALELLAKSGDTKIASEAFNGLINIRSGKLKPSGNFLHKIIGSDDYAEDPSFKAISRLVELAKEEREKPRVDRPIDDVTGRSGQTWGTPGRSAPSNGIPVSAPSEGLNVNPFERLLGPDAPNQSTPKGPASPFSPGAGALPINEGGQESPIKASIPISSAMSRSGGGQTGVPKVSRPSPTAGYGGVNPHSMSQPEEFRDLLTDQGFATDAYQRATAMQDYEAKKRVDAQYAKPTALMERENEIDRLTRYIAVNPSDSVARGRLERLMAETQLGKNQNQATNREDVQANQRQVVEFQAQLKRELKGMDYAQAMRMASVRFQNAVALKQTPGANSQTGDDAYMQQLDVTERMGNPIPMAERPKLTEWRSKNHLLPPLPKEIGEPLRDLRRAGQMLNELQHAADQLLAAKTPTELELLRNRYNALVASSGTVFGRGFGDDRISDADRPTYAAVAGPGAVKLWLDPKVGKKLTAQALDIVKRNYNMQLHGFLQDRGIRPDLYNLPFPDRKELEANIPYNDTSSHAPAITPPSEPVDIDLYVPGE